MAKQIKVFESDIQTIHTELEKLIAELEGTYTSIQKNAEIVVERWQGKAAVKTAEAIANEAKNLKKAIKEIRQVKEYVEKTSKAVKDADNQIKFQFVNIIG